MASNFTLALLACLLSTISYVIGGYAHGGGTGFTSSYGGGHGQGYGGGYNQDYYAKPKYSYSYGVNSYDDQKEAQESRDGDNVQGFYRLKESDGSWRTVQYVAGKGGFRANVLRTPGSHPGYGNGYNGRSGYGNGGSSFGYGHQG